MTEYNNLSCECNQLACVWKINPGSPQDCVYTCLWFLSEWTKSGRTRISFNPGRTRFSLCRVKRAYMNTSFDFNWMEAVLLIDAKNCTAY